MDNRNTKRIEWAKRKNREQKGGIKWKESPFDGMVIVTDSKERLKGIWDAKKKKDYLTNDENEYIRTHEDSVTIMTEENAQIADKEQERKPILLITTQRYFRWEKDEIKEYLHWGPVGQYKRSMIIFDEMPMLNEVRDVSIKTLNDIDSALWLGLDDEVDLRDKLWCINQWEHFRNWFEKMLFEFEQDRDISKFYFEPDRHNITEDDERFLRIINGNKGILNRNKYFKEYQDILTVKKLMDTWGIFSHRNADTDAYENKITVYFDNRDKVTGLDAKIIVLMEPGKYLRYTMNRITLK